ncbi:MAG TPA: M56 family metallopeptidase, partial [Candidatus Eremiobacteraceae bacterium]|nr:M56 family metallopeptidase [Candidatus Eremiobacteraceae bacterium]
MSAFFSHSLWAFLNSIWQSAVLTAIALGVTRLRRDIAPAARYALWITTLLACAALPLVDAAIPSGVVRAAPISEVVSNETYRVDPPVAVVHHAVPTRVRPTESTPGSADQTFKIESDATAKPTLLDTMVTAGLAIDAWLSQHAPAIGIVWASIAGILLLRLVIGTMRLAAIKRALEPIEEARVSRHRRSSKRRVVVGTCEAVESPCVIGYVRPVVALPSALYRELPEADLDKVLTHEFAHVRRFDDWTNLACQMVRAIWFANPFVHVAAHELDIEREIACDDLVADDRDGRLDYAKCLTEIARRSMPARHLFPAPSFFPDRKQIVVRIEQLLDGRLHGKRRLGFVPFVSAV